MLVIKCGKKTDLGGKRLYDGLDCFHTLKKIIDGQVKARKETDEIKKECSAWCVCDLYQSLHFLRYSVSRRSLRSTVEQMATSSRPTAVQQK